VSPASSTSQAPPFTSAGGDPCGGQRQPGLADPAWTQGHDRAPVERLANGLELLFAADETTQAVWEVAWTVACHPDRGMLTFVELDDALRRDAIVEADRAEITQVGSVEENARHGGGENLAAMTGGGDAGGNVPAGPK
jgi:hypothetical protein